MDARKIITDAQQQAEEVTLWLPMQADVKNMARLHKPVYDEHIAVGFEHDDAMQFVLRCGKGG